MSQDSAICRMIALCLIITSVLFAGCSTPVSPAPETGIIQLATAPAGAEIYVDREYRGTTPSAIPAITTGDHSLEFRHQGYEHWIEPITVTKGSVTNISVALRQIPATLPVTFATINAPGEKLTSPQIHVDGYWSLPPSSGTSSSTQLLVHTESFNVGSADAREVTVSANLYYADRQICWNRIYLGTLKTGDHVSKETMVTCTLPSGLNSPDLTIRFENVVVS